MVGDPDNIKRIKKQTDNVVEEVAMQVAIILSSSEQVSKQTDLGESSGRHLAPVSREDVSIIDPKIIPVIVDVFDFKTEKAKEKEIKQELENVFEYSEDLQDG
ncbi:hypothetical protein SUGI_0575120 [Cryptomeria japonica]|nr:hypothetical protein SUGI_0575120 [Cryptomeria japonica]